MDRSYTNRPFTVAACTMCPPDVADTVMPRLRSVIRNCPHGMLVLTKELLGTITRVTTDSSDGMVLLLQPCTTDRVPVASGHWVGPVRTKADAEAVCSWIAEGTWSRARLPSNLRLDVGRAQSNRSN